MKVKEFRKNIYQDETGQWWYEFGTKKTRTRCEVLKCDFCKKSFPAMPRKKARKYGRVFCSHKCASSKLSPFFTLKGKKHHAWRGGKIIVKNGYVEIYSPDHPAARGGKYVREHRLVMENYLGRFLYPWEQVHHKNGIKSDNHIENLTLIAKVPHLGEIECPYCNGKFLIR